MAEEWNLYRFVINFVTKLKTDYEWSTDENKSIHLITAVWPSIDTTDHLQTTWNNPQ
jgi:hypothetical protein